MNIIIIYIAIIASVCSTIEAQTLIGSRSNSIYKGAITNNEVINWNLVVSENDEIKSAFTRKGDGFITISKDFVWKAWNKESTSDEWIFKNISNFFNDLIINDLSDIQIAISDDVSKIAVIVGKKVLHVVDLVTGNRITVYKSDGGVGHEKIYSCSFSPDNEKVAFYISGKGKNHLMGEGYRLVCYNLYSKKLTYLSPPSKAVNRPFWPKVPQWSFNSQSIGFVLNFSPKKNTFQACIVEVEKPNGLHKAADWFSVELTEVLGSNQFLLRDQKRFEKIGVTNSILKYEKLPIDINPNSLFAGGYIATEGFKKIFAREGRSNILEINVENKSTRTIGSMKGLTIRLVRY